jgi:hypothetical protein
VACLVPACRAPASYTPLRGAVHLLLVEDHLALSSGGHTGVLRCQLRAVRAPPTSFAASALGGDGPPLLFAVVGAARAQTPICVGTGEGVRGVVGDGGGLPMRRVRLRRGRRRCLGLGAVYPVEGGTATPTKEGR